MKARLVLGLKVYSSVEADAHGNASDSWAAPVDWTVFGIAPRTAVPPEPSADRSEVISGHAVYAPKTGTLPGPLDLVVIDGEDWRVEGELGDYTRGPFGYAPGVVVNLTRVEG